MCDCIVVYSKISHDEDKLTWAKVRKCFDSTMHMPCPKSTRLNISEHQQKNVTNNNSQSEESMNTSNNVILISYLYCQWFRSWRPVKHEGWIPQRICSVPRNWCPGLLTFTTNNAIRIASWKEFRFWNVLASYHIVSYRI